MNGSYDELKQSNLDYTKLLQSPMNTIAVHENDSSNKINNSIDQKLSTNIVKLSDKCKVNEDRANPIEVLEVRSSGSVTYDVYLSYFIAGGKIYKILLFFFACIFTQVLVSSGDLWITYWYDSSTIYTSNINTFKYYNIV